MLMRERARIVDHQRVAVRRRSERLLGGDDAADARHVLDDERIVEHLARAGRRAAAPSRRDFRPPPRRRGCAPDASDRPDPRPSAADAANDSARTTTAASPIVLTLFAADFGVDLSPKHCLSPQDLLCLAPDIARQFADEFELALLRLRRHRIAGVDAGKAALRTDRRAGPSDEFGRLVEPAPQRSSCPRAPALSSKRDRARPICACGTKRSGVKLPARGVSYSRK